MVDGKPAAPVRRLLRAVRPFAIVLLPLGAAALLVGGGLDVLHPETLLARRDGLRQWVMSEPAFGLLSFAAIHLILVSTGLPVGPAMSLLAGFLFGRWLGTAAIIASSTGGALAVFGAARWSADTPFGARLRARAEPAYGRIEGEIRDNAFGYLIFARLVPFFPFFLVNVAAGLLRVRAVTFALATLIGRAPATFLYVSLGVEAGRIVRAEDLLSPGLVAGLTGLGLLALLPIGLRHLRSARTGGR